MSNAVGHLSTCAVKNLYLSCNDKSLEQRSETILTTHKETNILAHPLLLYLVQEHGLQRQWIVPYYLNSAAPYLYLTR
jgi:hypothetical protein